MCSSLISSTSLGDTILVEATILLQLAFSVGFVHCLTKDVITLHRLISPLRNSSLPSNLLTDRSKLRRRIVS